MQRILPVFRTVSMISNPLVTVYRLPNMLQGVLGQEKFLVPPTVLFTPAMGFKVKGRVRRRCKSCYLVVRDQRLYNICEKLPRHKQMAMKPKPHNTWILTHATQSPIRPW